MLVDRFSPQNLFLVVLLLILAGCGDEPRAKFSGHMVLALSWQPGFCETRRQLPECRSQTRNRADATRFSLHGLWPQPRSLVYCGTEDRYERLDKSRQWLKLPRLDLSDDLRQKLTRAMPGTQSGLHRHEWIKHGTCYAPQAEVYFHDSLMLMAAINESAVGALFAANIGKRLSSQTIRAAFDRAFGRGTGDRIKVSCRRVGGRTLITEITIGIYGKITPESELETLILNASPTRPGCPAGIIDEAGYQ